MISSLISHETYHCLQTLDKANCNVRILLQNYNVRILLQN